MEYELKQNIGGVGISPTVGKGIEDVKCGPFNSFKKCPSGFCCSNDGVCSKKECDNMQELRVYPFFDGSFQDKGGIFRERTYHCGDLKGSKCPVGYCCGDDGICKKETCLNSGRKYSSFDGIMFGKTGNDKIAPMCNYNGQKCQDGTCCDLDSGFCSKDACKTSNEPKIINQNRNNVGEMLDNYSSMMVDMKKSIKQIKLKLDKLESQIQNTDNDYYSVAYYKKQMNRLMLQLMTMMTIYKIKKIKLSEHLA